MLSTGYPQDIHRVIHRQKRCKLLIFRSKKKLSPDLPLPYYYYYIYYKKIKLI
jgi:hypothetical protein